MKTIKAVILFLVVLAFTSMQCEKSNVEKEEKLPAETQEGKNTFGCLVNGNLWIPKRKSMTPAVNTAVEGSLIAMSAKEMNLF